MEQLGALEAFSGFQNPGALPLPGAQRDPAETFYTRTKRLLKKHVGLKELEAVEEDLKLVSAYALPRKAVMLAADVVALKKGDGEAVRLLPLLLKRAAAKVRLKLAAGGLLGPGAVKPESAADLAFLLLPEDVKRELGLESKEAFSKAVKELEQVAKERLEKKEKRRLKKALELLTGKKLKDDEAQKLLEKLESGDEKALEKLAEGLLGLGPEELRKMLEDLSKELEEAEGEEEKEEDKEAAEEKEAEEEAPEKTQNGAKNEAPDGAKESAEKSADKNPGQNQKGA